MARFSPQQKEEPMQTLCRMVTDLKYEDLPENVVNQAKRCIIDTLAVMTAGSSAEGIPLMVDFVKDKGGKPESTIPFYGIRVPASEAGLATGPMARALDFGDYHEEALHSSEYTLPALLAALGLRPRVTGKELITAFVAGQEVLIRIGIAYRAGSKAGHAGRNSGHFIFGCVAAVGKLLGLSRSTLEEAEGIASEMTQPHTQLMYTPGTLMVRVHHGFICQDAINACLLAQRGITGPIHGILAAPRGYLGFATWETDAAALTRELGEQWEMMGVTMKHHPTVVYCQNAIDGMLDQMKEHDFKMEDIARIQMEGAPAFFIPGRNEGMYNPVTMPECQFSLPYVTATAACNGDFSLDAYSPQAMARQDVRELMPNITTAQDTSLPQLAVRITTTLKKSQTYTKVYIFPKGHPKNPLTEQDLKEKFQKCAKYSAFPLRETVVEQVIKNILSLEKVEDVFNSLIVPLTPE
jgi:2-methylcitrate dehydratase PrpD